MSRLLLYLFISLLMISVPVAASAQGISPIKKKEKVKPERDKYAYASSDVGRPKVMHLRTNLLYDLALLPNVGVELGLGRRWTFLGEGTLNWLSNNKKHRYWRVSCASLEARLWTGGVVSAILHRGHHFGIYAAAYRYDIEFGNKGQLGDINYGGGISYGYSAPIGRKLSLDFGLAVGYIGGKYTEYKPIDSHYVWQADKNRNYVGPTKLEVSLVWHIELTKKGGIQW